jgi:hypothetical protein
MTETFALSGAGNLFKQEDFDFCEQMEAKLAAMTSERDAARTERNRWKDSYWKMSTEREAIDLNWRDANGRLYEQLSAMTVERDALVQTCNELKTALRKIAALDFQNAATNGCAYEANALAHQALANAWSRAEEEGGKG